jgi:hypothetical protein
MNTVRPNSLISHGANRSPSPTTRKRLKANDQPYEELASKDNLNNPNRAPSDVSTASTVLSYTAAIDSPVLVIEKQIIQLLDNIPEIEKNSDTFEKIDRAMKSCQNIYNSKDFAILYYLINKLEQFPKSTFDKLGLEFIENIFDYIDRWTSNDNFFYKEMCKYLGFSNSSEETKNRFAALDRVFQSHLNMLKYKEMSKIGDYSGSNLGKLIDVYNNYEKKYSDFIESAKYHLSDKKISIQPRKFGMLPWIYEGISLLYPYPEESDIPKESYNEMYRILTHQAFCNFMWDDFSDEFRSQPIINIILNIFPSELEPTIYRTIKVGTEQETIDKNNASQVILKLINNDDELSKWPQETKEALAEYLAFTWIEFETTCLDIEGIINSIHAVEDSLAAPDISKNPVWSTIWENYVGLFNSYDKSLVFNNYPNIFNLIEAYKLSSHNMNIVPFYLEIEYLKLSKTITGKDAIVVRLESALFKEESVLDQKLGRIGNVIATCLPNNLNNNHSRELNMEDLSGIIDIFNRQQNSLDSYQKINLAFQKIVNQDRPGGVKDILEILKDSDCEYNLVRDFVQSLRSLIDTRNQILIRAQRTRRNSLSSGNNSPLTVTPAPPTPTTTTPTTQTTAAESVTPTLALLLHHLVSRGSI